MLSDLDFYDQVRTGVQSRFESNVSLPVYFRKNSYLLKLLNAFGSIQPHIIEAFKQVLGSE